MTIIFQGHIEKIEQGSTPGGARLTIRPEARRDLAPVSLEAFKGEADAYKVGGIVEVRITPAYGDCIYITPYESVYRQIAETLGVKGEIWTADTVLDHVKDLVERAKALKRAIG